MSATAPFPITDGNFMMEKEPIVRIGLVLVEDAKTTIELVAPVAGFTADFGGATLELPAGKAVRAEVSGGAVRLVGPASGEGSVLRIIPPASYRPSQPNDGLLLRGVIAGRGFHWQKLIDASYTDVIELSVQGGKLIVVNEIPIETYLVGVITGEMSGDCPVELLKAQAVAARAWLLGQPTAPHPGQPFLWCNDDCCQRYQGTGGWSPAALEAIDQCRGQVLITREGHYCDARYSKSTGGISEDAESVWGRPISGLESMIDAPKASPAEKFFPVTDANIDEYLNGAWLEDTQCFASPNVVPESTICRYLGRVDEAGEYFRWDLSFTHAELCASLAKRGGIADIGAILDLRTGTRGRSGRLEQLFVDYLSTTGEKKTATLAREYNIRAGISMRFLFSSCFTLRLDHDANGHVATAHLRGGGWGHGAGLCQIGALGRAIKGQDCETILLAYYAGTTLERIYD